MGDIADMMLDGVLCEGCGEYMGEGFGVPQRCDGCAMPYAVKPTAANKIPCFVCGKKIKVAGMRDHLKDVHKKGTQT